MEAWAKRVCERRERERGGRGEENPSEIERE